MLGIPDQVTPLIESETRAAAACLPAATLLLGRQATARALATLGQSSRFIHIATHGAFRKDNPMFSSLRLGDSYLTALDLRQLNLAAEMVTLSGCSTGLNLVVVGDELLGLVRGLLHAGASSVLVSLWDVNDRTTSDFMVSFYNSLRHETNKAAALRSAMQAIRKTHPHPYYWAPFVLTGQYHA